MGEKTCPRCSANNTIKSGKANDRQRYLCKSCNYHFTVDKLGKRIDNYYVIKALQLYLQGLGYRQIERILGVSHVTVMKWVKHFFREVPQRQLKEANCKIMSVEEVCEYMKHQENIHGKGFVIAHLGSKILMIQWEAETAP